MAYEEQELQDKCKEIDKLFSSTEFHRLVGYNDGFNIFRMMKIQTKELIHSNIIAYLLDPHLQDGIDHLFLDKFILAVSSFNVSVGDGLGLPEAISLLGEKVRVHRELSNIDIVIDFFEKRTVIAIENKINHVERESQISDYQDKLPEIYRNYKKFLIVFLTPNGKNSTTANAYHQKTSVCVASYLDILNIVDSVREKASGNIGFFLNQFSAHLKENIVGNNEIKKLCIAIYKKYPRAYKSMINNLPDLGEMEDCYFQKIKEKYPSLVFSSYSTRENIKTELSFKNPDWAISDVHIKIFLDQNDFSVKIFAAIGKDNAKKMFNKLNDVFKIEPVEVEPGWWWWAFTVHGVYEVENEDAFGEQATQDAVEKFEKIYLDINDRLLNFKNCLT